MPRNPADHARDCRRPNGCRECWNIEGAIQDRRDAAASWRANAGRARAAGSAADLGHAAACDALAASCEAEIPGLQNALRSHIIKADQDGTHALA
jgi:hypothetical protein